MSRKTHFGIGIGILLVSVVWCVLGVFIFFGLAAGKDSRGASIYDSSFITLYVIFGCGLLVGLWASFQSFRRAFRHDERVVPPASPTESSQQTDLATPDEKLAHLEKKL